jgi:Tol biopolymer transport system component
MSPGQAIAHYRIHSKLGEGGMGEVWRATDTKLNRDVALKVLPEGFAQDSDRMARFQREAQVLASLNHPNIGAIYGTEERALVMELVEGPTLAERIARGPVPLDEALPAARQIAEAVEYAHERGIIHRDLKPANIKMTPEGRIKVLDFGLAKAMGTGTDTAAADPQLSPTLTMNSTVAGVILGTAAYMSPEQAKGKPIDRRADIWAFGVVLVEMLTGARLYHGETVSETLAAVLLKEPDLSRLPKATPVSIRALIRRCLNRDPLRRLRDIGEARLILEQPESAATETTPTPRLPGGWIAAGVLAAALAAVLILHFRPVQETRVFQLAVLPPKDTFLNASGGVPAISPDGHRVAFAGTTNGRDALWLRDLDSLAAHSLPGTDNASHPFWSPDGRYLGFFADGKLKKMEIAGGPAVTLCDAVGPAGGSWSRRGIIVFAKQYQGDIKRVPEEGGSPQPATKMFPGTQTGQRFPSFLPDGRHFLFFSRLNDEVEKTGIYVASLDSLESHLLLPSAANAVYAPPGYLLYLRQQSLMAQPFDAGQLRFTGKAVVVAEEVDRLPNIGQGGFSASDDGVLVYTSRTQTGFPQLTWFDRSGKPTGTLGTPAGMQWPAISPDGKVVAVDQQDPVKESQELWLHDVARGVSSRFTFNLALSRYAVWSPDGSHLAFVSNRDGAFKIYRKAVSGSSPEELLHTTPPAWPVDWSQDGRYLIMEVPQRPSHPTSDLWVLPLFGDRKAFPYLETNARERWGRLSRDGKWLAYGSDESGRFEVYVATFPKPSGKWQVSTGGGSVPVWGRDGQNLFFLAPDRKMMAVGVKGGERFEAGAPKALFDTHIVSGPQARFDVGPDGRFIIPVQPEQTAVTQMTVVVNWSASLPK